MMTDEQFNGMLSSIVKRQLEALDDVAEKQDQTTEDVYEKLNQAIKDEIRKSLENLWTLFDDYVDQDDCTLATVLEYIPWIAIYGLWIGAQIGVSQDEYYTIVDYFLVKSNLIKEG